MAQPESDDGAVDTGLQHLKGHGVSKQMHGDPLPLEGRTHFGGGLSMFVEHIFYPMDGQTPTLGIWKYRTFIAFRKLAHPSLKYSGRRLRQWGAAGLFNAPYLRG